MKGFEASFVEGSFEGLKGAELMQAFKDVFEGLIRAYEDAKSKSIEMPQDQARLEAGLTVMTELTRENNVFVSLTAAALIQTGIGTAEATEIFQYAKSSVKNLRLHEFEANVLRSLFQSGTKSTDGEKTDTLPISDAVRAVIKTVLASRQ